MGIAFFGLEGKEPTGGCGEFTLLSSLLMFSLGRRAHFAFRLVRHASLSSRESKYLTGTHTGPELVKMLETDNSKILKLVRRKVDERTALMAEVRAFYAPLTLSLGLNDDARRLSKSQ